MLSEVFMFFFCGMQKWPEINVTLQLKIEYLPYNSTAFWNDIFCLFLTIKWM